MVVFLYFCKSVIPVLNEYLWAICKFSIGNSHSNEDKFVREFSTLKAGEALKERQCTLEGQALNLNVQGSVHTTYNVYD